MEIDGKKEGISERFKRDAERERERERLRVEGGGKLRGCVALSSAS